ncbi:MAG: DNA polymerase IV [Propionibacterium sp.]|nr:MAG: DNA polymerase IV [Propionibacterium sp.]
MRSWASILHLDLDAFFAAVEQRDKPSLRGRPVVVGGTGPRGVVATASYEAREFGVRSAMSSVEARRRAPRAAFLAGRFDAYRQSSQIVMKLLGQLSPLVEPLSLDEAFVDLAAGGYSPEDIPDLVRDLRAELTKLTEGLTASVGVGSSKFIAKVASELAKPDGVHFVLPGDEIETIAPLSVRAIPGVGPVAEQRLAQLGIRSVSDLQQARPTELMRELGKSWGGLLADLAFARDDRAVSAARETKSISTEDTFLTDISDLVELNGIIDRGATQISDRLAKAGLFARTITIKVRLADFTTMTRSHTLAGAICDQLKVAQIAKSLLSAIDISGGVRLLGIGVSGFAEAAQEPLFEDGFSVKNNEYIKTATTTPNVVGLKRDGTKFRPGCDVVHPNHGRGWVWGSGMGRVTARFETRYTGVGRVHTFAEDELELADELLELAGDDLSQPEIGLVTLK